MQTPCDFPQSEAIYHKLEDVGFLRRSNTDRPFGKHPVLNPLLCDGIVYAIQADCGAGTFLPSAIEHVLIEGVLHVAVSHCSEGYTIGRVAEILLDSGEVSKDNHV